LRWRLVEVEGSFRDERNREIKMNWNGVGEKVDGNEICGVLS
jgi:hypothetical protein